MKKRWIVAVITAAILSVVVIILKYRYRPPICMVRTNSPQPNHLDISWFDEELDQIYTVYWSNRPGINVKDPETYKSSQTVASVPGTVNHRFHLTCPYEIVYFRIAKGKVRTREFNVRVLLDDSFAPENLDPRVLARNAKEGVWTMEVRVLKEAEEYRLHYHYSDGTHAYQDYNTRGMKDVMLKLDTKREAMLTLSYVKSNVRSEEVFVLHLEEIFLYSA